MQFFLTHPWLLFIAGAWLGVFVGCGVALVLAGSRVQDLEAKKAFLQMKLDNRSKARMKLRQHQHAA